MKKNGFTLIELLGVIIVLGIVLLIVNPIVKNITTSNKEQLYEIQIDNIRSGLQNWAIDNSRLLPEIEGEALTVTLGELKDGGYVEPKLKNPKTNKCFGNDMVLIIERYQKNYIYTVDETTGTETSTCG